MFALKWIADNGAEMIYGGRDISYTPGDAEKKATVTFYDENGTHCSFDAGRIFVMNDRGRTVADYLLSSPGFPHGLAPRQAA